MTIQAEMREFVQISCTADASRWFLLFAESQFDRRSRLSGWHPFSGYVLLNLMQITTLLLVYSDPKIDEQRGTALFSYQSFLRVRWGEWISHQKSCKFPVNLRNIAPKQLVMSCLIDILLIPCMDIFRRIAAYWLGWVDIKLDPIFDGSHSSAVALREIILADWQIKAFFILMVDSTVWGNALVQDAFPIVARWCSQWDLLVVVMKRWNNASWVPLSCLDRALQVKNDSCAIKKGLRSALTQQGETKLPL